jgi:Subtilase family
MFTRIIQLILLSAILTSCAAPAEPSQQNLPDWRGLNLSQDDLSNREDDLFNATFDTLTKWPSSEKPPEEFDPQQIMELGKDPGLGVRELHIRGITGQGIGIAIIDQVLLKDHVEYKDRLRQYDETDDVNLEEYLPKMHGAAVSSIAVGQTVGVAPGADLYYVATSDMCDSTSVENFDFSCRANAIRRVVEINKTLPEDQKIKVLSMSFGWWPQGKGYENIKAAVDEAKAEGIFVISSNLDETYGLHFHGLGREPLADPDQFESYLPGLWWEKDFYDGMPLKQTLLVPMDSRATASEQGPEHYVFYREGGWSWSIPYLAGMYALAAQVKPEITPEEFWNLALETGQTTKVKHGWKNYELGTILDPQALIAALEK